jgi:hypothetical protein
MSPERAATGAGAGALMQVLDKPDRSIDGPRPGWIVPLDEPVLSHLLDQVPPLSKGAHVLRSARKFSICGRIFTCKTAAGTSQTNCRGSTPARTKGGLREPTSVLRVAIVGAAQAMWRDRRRHGRMFGNVPRHSIRDSFAKRLVGLLTGCRLGQRSRCHPTPLSFLRGRASTVLEFVSLLNRRSGSRD